ncbi:Decaprenyl diphosphate synthase-like protein [Mycena filopes]|nr:Decaprenyl diphosphate synthase-like protein [Mycena filopes]
MDGNRRWARAQGKPVLFGHTEGAATAGKVIEWWLDNLPPTLGNQAPPPLRPKFLTCWVFSSENFGREAGERDGLFALMTAEFKSLAFSSVVHLFRIRISFIGGDRARFPPALVEAMTMVEETTAGYSALFLQFAVGYGGREEVVSAVHDLVDEGVAVTEGNISRRMYCEQKGIPPVDLIIRTSERRTSGFFLWDTQAAELHFVNKLWPQVSELDWLRALKSFSTRELRGGK